MPLSKLFLVLLLLVKTISSTKYNYCNDLFRLNVTAVGRRLSIPVDYKHQIIEEINRERNNLNKPMNYVNWDNELDKVALNLLKITTFNRPSLGYLGCLVQNPPGNDLYLYADSARGITESNVLQVFKLTTRPKFYGFATEEQNITYVGCAIWNLELTDYNTESFLSTHIMCLFSGINGRLLDINNPKFINLRGQILPISNYSISALYIIIISLTCLLISVVSFILIYRQ